MSHVSIETQDLERSLAFYQRIFGFQVIFDREQSGAEFETIVGVPGARSRMIRGLIGGNAVVQLWWHSWREPSKDERTLMSFEVRDALVAYEALKSEGVPCQSEPVDFPNCTAFVIADPDGHPMEIIRWKGGEEPYRIPQP